MEFNDGSQYRVLTDVAAYRTAGRDLYAYRVASKRSDGFQYVDTAFQYHRKATAGLRGTLLYQFAYANLLPEDVADFFCQAVGGGLQTQEMVCLDLEMGGGFTASNVLDWASRWLTFVEDRLQTRAWVYVPGSLASPLNRLLTSGRIIWAPRYSGTSQRGTAPGWRHDVHQFTDRGSFPGCSASGDTSYTTLTTEAMLARCNPTGTTSTCGS